MSHVRVYRYWPFLLVTTLVGLLIDVSALVEVVRWFAGAPGYEAALKGTLFLVPMLAFAVFLVLSWRVRTIVDDNGVTQHHRVRRVRIPLADLTDVQPVYGNLGWYLQLTSGEQTFEVIPCVPPLLGFGGGVPPRALVACQADIETRRP